MGHDFEMMLEELAVKGVIDEMDIDLFLKEMTPAGCLMAKNLMDNIELVNTELNIPKFLKLREKRHRNK